MQTKKLAFEGTSIVDFLSMALEPPSKISISKAIASLIYLGALDKNENLTNLGKYLVLLSIPPNLGKMLFYSLFLKCLDPVLTIVATLAHKDPFILPTNRDQKELANKRRKSLSCNSLSDHMILLKCYQMWQEKKKGKETIAFGKEYFISLSNLRMIMGTRNQLLAQLRGTGFLLVNGSQGDLLQQLNIYSEKWAVVKAALVAGLYPNVAFTMGGGKLYTKTEKKVVIGRNSCAKKYFQENDVSVDVNLSNVWYVFQEMARLGNICQIRNVTTVTPITVALLCGSDNNFDRETSILTIDDFIEFHIPSKELWTFKSVIDEMFNRKILCPSSILNLTDNLILNTLVNVLVAQDVAVNLREPKGIGFKPPLNYNFETVPDPMDIDLPPRKGNFRNGDHKNLPGNNLNWKSRQFGMGVCYDREGNHPLELTSVSDISGSSKDFDRNTQRFQKNSTYGHSTSHRLRYLREGDQFVTNYDNEHGHSSNCYHGQQNGYKRFAHEDPVQRGNVPGSSNCKNIRDCKSNKNSDPFGFDRHINRQQHYRYVNVAQINEEFGDVNCRNLNNDVNWNVQHPGRCYKDVQEKNTIHLHNKSKGLDRTSHNFLGFEEVPHRKKYCNPKARKVDKQIDWNDLDMKFNSKSPYEKSSWLNGNKVQQQIQKYDIRGDTTMDSSFHRQDNCVASTSDNYDTNPTRDWGKTFSKTQCNDDPVSYFVIKLSKMPVTEKSCWKFSKVILQRFSRELKVSSDIWFRY